MPSSDAFALSRSGLNEFLFAPVGTEANGMTLSLVSVFARLGNDPWLEAGRLAGLPKSAATENLARIIAGMPASMWQLSAATVIADRLIALLPTQSAMSRPIPLAPAIGAKGRHFFSVAVVLVGVACLLAFGSGFFTALNAPKPDGSSVTNLVVPPR